MIQLGGLTYYVVCCVCVCAGVCVCVCVCVCVRVRVLGVFLQIVLVIRYLFQKDWLRAKVLAVVEEEVVPFIISKTIVLILNTTAKKRTLFTLIPSYWHKEITLRL